VDIQGRVVGIGVLRESPSPADAAATQILPINLVLNLFEALKVARSHRSPWLGVSVLELPLLRQRLAARASAARIPRTGVYVDDVFDPSPASRAGVRPGDFLVALGGHDVRSVGDFQRWLYVLGIDTDVELGLVRDGQPVQAVARIEVRPPAATTR
jgi:S1-C subfamily serine protease